MKNLVYSMSLIFILSTACDDKDISVFDKTADERVAEAIASLKEDLTDPEDGWLVKYKPVEETGSYYVLMKFDEDNKVTIRTDLGASDGKYQEQTIGYRIDSSLGLELILENYSFFSYLFEQDQASFGAEYEFNFVNKTPDGALVFSSKTDLSTPTVLLFEQATGDDQNLLGEGVGVNLNLLGNDLDRFSSALKLTYLNKDVIFYVSLEEQKRIIHFNVAARKSNPAVTQAINKAVPYYLEGNSLILETPVSTTVSGSTVNVASITLNTLGETTINTCTDPFTVHTYAGKISSDDVLLETTMNDLAGATFVDESNFYFCPLNNIRRNSLPLVDEITADIAGALEFDLYYGAELRDGSILYGIGFLIQNTDNSITFAYRKFTPVLNGNNITFNFEPGIFFLGEEETTAEVANINKYLDALTAGNNTYVFKYATDIYEFNNPCTGWSFVFVNGN
jgi:hypothetical protein